MIFALYLRTRQYHVMKMYFVILSVKKSLIVEEEVLLKNSFDSLLRGS